MKKTAEEIIEMFENCKKMPPISFEPEPPKPELCHVINGKNFWLDETLSEKQRDSILAFIKAVTKFSGK